MTGGIFYYNNDLRNPFIFAIQSKNDEEITIHLCLDYKK